MNELRTSTRIYFWLRRCYKTYFRASLWNHLPVECWSSFRSFSILDDQLKIFIENILVLYERSVPWEDVLWPPNNVTLNCCVSWLLSSPTPHLVTIYCSHHLQTPVVTSVTQWYHITEFCLHIFFWEVSPVCNEFKMGTFYFEYSYKKNSKYGGCMFFGTFLTNYLIWNTPMTKLRGFEEDWRRLTLKFIQINVFITLVCRKCSI